MRIGFFTDFYLPRIDGIAYSTESFRQELEAMGHEVFVITARPSLRFKEPSKRIIRFPAVKGLFFDDYLMSFFFPPQAQRQIEKLELDIIHFHTPGQLGLLGAFYALRNNVPLVTTYHTDLFEYVKHYPAVLPGVLALTLLVPASTGGSIGEIRRSLSSIKPERSIDKWNQKLVERGITALHNHCDLVISPSPKIRKQLKSWKTIPPVVVLPSGVDAITTNDAAIEAARTQFSILPNDKVVLFVGRVGTEKNIGMLIEAFEFIGAKDPMAKLLIVGSGDDLEDFRLQASKSAYASRIQLPGAIPHAELGAIYGLASVFAFPSTADTQGLVVNEAAWAGLPIVMVDKNVSEVVQNGKNGYFARNNPRDLANKILQLLGDPKRRQQMSVHSREMAAQFGVSQQSRELVQLYKETIKRHASKPPTKRLLGKWPGPLG